MVLNDLSGFYFFSRNSLERFFWISRHLDIYTSRHTEINYLLSSYQIEILFMQTCSCISLSGRQGKTTSIFSAALLLAQQGKKVLEIDSTPSRLV